MIILDAKDAFSKQRLFQNAWKELYPDHLEWVSLSKGGKVNAVDAATKTLKTDFSDHKADVANVIPPQRAGRDRADAPASRTARAGARSIRSRSSRSCVPNIHVIGDAAIMGAMPKSAFSANAQAKVCAAAVATLLRGREAGRAAADQHLLQPGRAGLRHHGRGRVQADRTACSPTSRARAGSARSTRRARTRALEAQFAEGWFKTITGEVFG